MILLNKLLENLSLVKDSQQSYQPWKPESASQQLGDFGTENGGI